MGNKMCPKVIIEGTRLTFKTELAFILNDHPGFVGNRNYRYHSPIISAEWCAFTNFPWGRGMINYEPQEEALAMETYEAWMHLLELQKYYSWIIDRFHISTQAYQLTHYNNKIDFSALEKRLADIGFSIVYLHRDSKSFESAKQLRLEVSGNPSQYDDLNMFIQEQKLMDSLISDSKLPVLKIDISNNDVKGAADKVADWLKQSGKLWADY